jgi:hypothetical protein
MAAGKIGTDAVFQHFRLADVYDRPVLVFHQVATRFVRQQRELVPERLGMVQRLRAVLRHGLSPLSGRKEKVLLPARAKKNFFFASDTAKIWKSYM